MVKPITTLLISTYYLQLSMMPQVWMANALSIGTTTELNDHAYANGKVQRLETRTEPGYCCICSIPAAAPTGIGPPLTEPPCKPKCCPP